MSSEYLRLVYVFTDLILPLIVGYFLHQKKIVPEKFANWLMKFNVIVIYTLLSLLSFWVVPLLREMLFLFPFGALYVIVPGIIAALTFAKRHKNLLNRGAYVMSAMLSNMGTLGGVCAFILYGAEGFAYSQIVGTSQLILLVILCFPLAQYYHEKHFAANKVENVTNWRQRLFGINQISFLGIIAGLALNVNHVPRPEFFSDLFQGLVHFGAWTALLPVGFLINFSHAKFYYSRVWDLAILRFLIMPAFIYFVGRMFFNHEILLNTLLICATAPTAINAVITSKLYRLNVNLAIASFIMTTAIFLLIIFPVMFFILK